MKARMMVALARGSALRAPAALAVPVDDVADHDTQCGADGGDDEEFEAGTQGRLERVPRLQSAEGHGGQGGEQEGQAAGQDRRDGEEIG